MTAALQVVLVGALVVTVAQGEWDAGVSIAGAIVVTLLPWVLHRLGVAVPPGWQLVLAAFATGALLLGSAAGWYSRFWWWDVVLHTASGALLAVVGFVVLFALSRTDAQEARDHPWFVALFGFTTGVTSGVFWEFAEWAADSLVTRLDLEAGRSYTDTMQDLLVDTAGAGLAALLALVHLRTGRTNWVSRGVAAFVRRNPHLSAADG